MRRRRTSQQSNLKGVRAYVMGQDGVGKSAFIVRFLTRRFITEYDQTSEFTYRHHLALESEDLHIDLIDTAGENTNQKLERFSAEGDVFFILYSIADRSSFEEACRIGRFVKDRQNSRPSPLTLVGTKRDLEHFRNIDETEGSELASELGSSFYEISTASADGYKEISDMVNDCLRKFLKRDRSGAPVRRTPSSSSLTKMKEGLIRRTGSFRRKSVC